jgi:molybdenum cofactor cytidylyltransferase
MSANHNIALLILAAGESTRMGNKIKQLLPWKDTTLIGNAIRQAQKTRIETIGVVLGANFEVINQSIQTNTLAIIKNTNWQSGMGSSIMVGINYLLSMKNEYEGILIMLADQPLIDDHYLNQLIDKIKETDATIIATSYQNGAGVPAYFDKCHFDALLKLNKDFGARKIMKNDTTFVIDPRGKEVDLDTWHQYQELLNHK